MQTIEIQFAVLGTKGKPEAIGEKFAKLLSNPSIKLIGADMEKPDNLNFHLLKFQLESDMEIGHMNEEDFFTFNEAEIKDQIHTACQRFLTEPAVVFSRPAFVIKPL